MSRDIDNIAKEIIKANKEIHSLDTKLSKDVNEIKKTIKNIDNKIKSIERKINEAIEILHTFAILITDSEDILDLDREEEDNSSDDDEWNPYDNPESFDNNYNDENE